MGNPSNSSRGPDNDKGLCGRTTPGETGKDVPTGDGNEGEWEAEDDPFDECDVDDLDLEVLVFRGAPLGVDNESERVE